MDMKGQLRHCEELTGMASSLARNDARTPGPNRRYRSNGILPSLSLQKPLMFFHALHGEVLVRQFMARVQHKPEQLLSELHGKDQAPLIWTAVYYFLHKGVSFLKIARPMALPSHSCSQARFDYNIFGD